MHRFNSILETIGGTPVVRLGKLAPPGVEVFVKLKSRNPLGSVKDRLALALIEDAEARGTPLFADIPTDMTEQEIALSQSTPGARFFDGLTT
jgi:hypothetical protein